MKTTILFLMAVVFLGLIATTVAQDPRWTGTPWTPNQRFAATAWQWPFPPGTPQGETEWYRTQGIVRPWNAAQFLTGQGTRDWGSGTGFGNAASGAGNYLTGMGNYLWGKGQYMQGLGAYHLDTSVATINREEAWYRDMLNQNYHVHNYFDMRRANRIARANERGPLPTLDDLQRYAKINAPERLSLDEYEPALGVIFWPEVLKTPIFDGPRQAIDQLATFRETGPYGIGTPKFRKICQLADDMETILRSQIRNILPKEYVIGKNFLASLRFEMEFGPKRGPKPITGTQQPTT